MSIKPVKVERDQDGYWVHPDFPEWDEGTGRDVIDKWFNDNGIRFEIDMFEDSDTASEELKDRYFEHGECDISEWNPSCNAEHAFLLSIHDTEDGPVAVFAVPKNGE